MQQENKLKEISILKGFLKEVGYFLYEEKDLEEININSYDEVFLKYPKKKCELKKIKMTKKDWEIFFIFLSHKYKGESYQQGTKLVITLAGGHRFNGVIGENVVNGMDIKSGISVTIRVYQPDSQITLCDFEVSKKMQNILEQRVKQKDNIFLSGATGSGKTTFLNLLIKFIPLAERIITIEDIWELKVANKNKTEIMPKNDNYDEILDFCMKSTPERLLLGELTTKNVHAVEKFITSGHKGFLMTMHADNPKQAITDTFFAKFPADKKGNTNYAKEVKLLAENIDMVIQLNMNRKLTHIYFPKEDKEYIFPKDEASFLLER